MNSKRNNAAIYYLPEGFEASGGGQELVGRRVAGEAFLKGFARYSNVDALHCYAANEQLFGHFKSHVANLAGWQGEFNWISWLNPDNLARPGCLYMADPVLADQAWLRRRGEQRSYSISGVTHTIAEGEFMDAVANYFTAPLQSWDALVCTSQVVKDTLEKVIDDWADYMEQRIGKRIVCPVQRPIIPLGVDCGQFFASDKNETVRVEIRQKLGIKEDDVVVLYMGRFSFNGKANPYPMLVALENVARETSRKIVLVQAGWFSNKANEQAFIKASQQFAPNVTSIFVDGRLEQVRTNIWYIADIFTSLVDNIQETFGITPIEAMAAGLPVVVSDWNGYRDTVVHDVTGFRVSTCMPEAGDAGDEIALRYQAHIDGYDSVLTNTSACVAVNLEEAISAFRSLVESPELRRQMGDAGRERAREIYDWKAVIPQYQDLWKELEQRRKRDVEIAPCQSDAAPVNPLRQDPFACFGSYSTGKISDSTLLRQQTAINVNSFDQLRQSELFLLAMPGLLPVELSKEILSRFETGTLLSQAEVLSGISVQDSARAKRTIAWMIKVGLLSIADRGSKG